MLAIGAHVVRQRANDQWTGTTGAGALVGVIDTGLDITHPDFRDDDGASRVAGSGTCCWGARRPPASPTACTAPQRHPVGRGHGQQRLLSHRGLQWSRHARSRNGRRQWRRERRASSLAGVAPRAELLIVRAGNGTFGEDRVIDGTVWIRQQAEAMGRPVVLNLSLGHQAGPHDGTLLFERMLDDMSGPGFVVVAAAGNEGENRNTVMPDATPPHLLHARLDPPAGAAAAAEFVITPYTPSPNPCVNNFVNINGWYEVRDRMHVTVTRPSGVSVTAAPGTAVVGDDFAGRIEISNAVPLQPQGTAQVSILISGCGPGGAPGPAPGRSR
jgi:subtilisin family serine protease